MNKSVIACLVLLLAIKLFSDVIPPDSHVVERSVFITNTSAYPQVYLIGIVKFVGSRVDSIYRIQDNVPLYKGYKFNTLDLFAIETSLVTTKISLDSSAVDHIYSNYAPAEVLDPFGGTVTNDDPLQAEQYFYRIERITDTNLYLKLFMGIFKYNDGSPDKTIFY
jgi:hypothetical protein